MLFDVREWSEREKKKGKAKENDDKKNMIGKEMFDDKNEVKKKLRWRKISDKKDMIGKNEGK